MESAAEADGQAEEREGREEGEGFLFNALLAVVRKIRTQRKEKQGVDCGQEHLNGMWDMGIGQDVGYGVRYSVLGCSYSIIYCTVHSKKASSL